MFAMVSFDPVVDAYDAGRPGYPDAVFDALEPLAGRLVLDGGAGTGIATRQIAARAARVVPFDIGPAVLRRNRDRSPGVAPVVADGARLPFRDACADWVCFAQSWHWLDDTRRCAETARVLGPGGRWAGWWSHARADDEAWFQDYWALIETACPGTNRGQRDTDWGDTVARSGLFEVEPRITISWTRHVPVDAWLVDQASQSYVMALDPLPRRTLLAALRPVVEEWFPGRQMAVPYETWLWTATRQ